MVLMNIWFKSNAIVIYQIATMIFVLLIYLNILRLALAASPEEKSYLLKRQQIIDDEIKSSVGGSITLSGAEVTANKILMNHKHKELDKGFEHPAEFPPARSFLESKPDIEKSEVFKMLKRLPKGAALHIHSVSMVSAEYVVKNLTYDFADNLYLKIDKNGALQGMGYYKTPPDGNWEEVKQLRKGNPKDFDNWLMYQIQFDQSHIGLDINSIWQKFSEFFDLIREFVTYEPVWDAYFYQALQEFHDDNVNYMEFRGELADYPVYRLDGSILTEEEVCQRYVDILKEFKRNNPTFFGARLILANLRLINNKKMKDFISKSIQLKEKFPDLIAGLDFVGQEDLGETLETFAEDLLKNKHKLNYFFHAGETNWSGFSTDLNLVDAIAIGTKRIGHGYAMTKHPKACQLAKTERIGIELNPISNQVLALVKDLRNHPGAQMFLDNYPVCINSDDPGFWGTKGLSYDWYAAFMGLAAKWQDLRLLKQLALNSIEFTSLTQNEKKEFRSQWDQQWQTFLNKIQNRRRMKFLRKTLNKL